MSAFRSGLRTALWVLPLAIVTAALIVILDRPQHPHRPQTDWLTWFTLTVPFYTSGARGCRWASRRLGAPPPPRAG